MLARDALESRLREAFPDAVVEIHDLTGTEDHYEVRLVSSHFTGLSSLQRHRLVYAALKEPMRGAIHALSLITESPEERSP